MAQMIVTDAEPLDRESPQLTDAYHEDAQPQGQQHDRAHTRQAIVGEMHARCACHPHRGRQREQRHRCIYPPVETPVIELQPRFPHGIDTSIPRIGNGREQVRLASLVALAPEDCADAVGLGINVPDGDVFGAPDVVEKGYGGL
jgi:hypothetical protein